MLIKAILTYLLLTYLQSTLNALNVDLWVHSNNIYLTQESALPVNCSSTKVLCFFQHILDIRMIIVKAPQFVIVHYLLSCTNGLINGAIVLKRELLKQ